MTETLYEIEGPWQGRLAIASRPRGGEWLEDDVRALRAAGVDVLVSLLSGPEVVELGLAAEQALAQSQGIEFVSFPIEDRGVPRVAPTEELQACIADLLAEGKTVAVHCRSGIGRSTIVVAPVLAIAGVPLDVAFRRIEEARGLSVPDTPEQKAWVETFVKQALGARERTAS